MALTKIKLQNVMSYKVTKLQNLPSYKVTKLQKSDVMNTCHYSSGSKHELCDHQNYCIFNDKRTDLETTITHLENRILEFENKINLIESDDIQFTIPEYKQTLKKLRTTTDELNRLKNYRETAMRSDKYGYNR